MLREGAHCLGDNGFAPTETKCRVQWFWKEDVSLRWPESRTKSHVRSTWISCVNGEAAFNVNGVYTVSRGYDMDMGVPSTTINYTYEVVNGLVTDMQVVVQQ